MIGLLYHLEWGTNNFTMNTNKHSLLKCEGLNSQIGSFAEESCEWSNVSGPFIGPFVLSYLVN